MFVLFSFDAFVLFIIFFYNNLFLNRVSRTNKQILKKNIFFMQQLFSSHADTKTMLRIFLTTVQKTCRSMKNKQFISRLLQTVQELNLISKPLEFFGVPLFFAPLTSVSGTLRPLLAFVITFHLILLVWLIQEPSVFCDDLWTV